MDAPQPAEKKASFLTQIRGLPANFWYANFMEILERLAFFGVRAIAPLYLIRQADENGLGLTYTDKGNIYMWWALIQCLVPMVSGGFTERYGYRKSLVVAFLINIVGYLGMAQSKPIADYLIAQGWSGAGYWVFLAAACLVGFGTAIFKPPCHGTIAKSTTEETSSMGWGLFYWVVNIGGALAPMCAAQLRGEINWHYVFYGAAIVTACNFIPLFVLYREPEKTPPKEGEREKGAVGTFISSIATIFKDLRLVVFLLVFSCFWLMFMQLWDLLPNFIDEWVDTSDVAPWFKAISDGWVLESGQTKPEMIININSVSIILLVIFISWLIRKLNKVAAMIIGMVIAMVGFVASGSTMLGWFCCLMILVFSIGEMTCSPTFSAYVGLIAPKDKKALYMGYSNIPFAIGWALGNLVGGYVYDAYGARATLALEHLATDTTLVARAAQASDWSDTLDKLPPLLEIDRGEAFNVAREQMGLDAEAAAQSLRENFKYDQGQLENLALLYVATRPESKAKTVTGLTDALKDEVQQLAAGEKAQEDIQQIETMLTALASDEVQLDQLRLARLVHLLPRSLNTTRSVVFGKVRMLVNPPGVAPAEAKQDAEIVDMLWQQFGDDQEVLNNLALEYLAQSTSRVHDIVAQMTFEHPPEQLKQRAAEIEERLGIASSKAFAALSAALGRDDAEVDKLLAEVDVSTGSASDRLFVYLIRQPERRYAAVARQDWKKDQTLLRQLIRSDEKALRIAKEGLAKQSWTERISGAARGLFGAAEQPGEMTEEGIDYRKLAGKADLIQRALAAKDWTQAPDEAARLLRLNPLEARALVAGNDKATTQVLWDSYHPIVVWYYLGAFGVVGTLGMIIFYLATRKSALEGEANQAAA
jgi:POT family proton-dependent oligopeptide transporter